MDSSVGLLHGYRALDLTDLKGQLCGRLLADLGMEVVKIEPPGGDAVRRLPPFKEGGEGPPLSLLFAHLNANKRSIVLDLEVAKDRAAFFGLVEGADVVLESFPPGLVDSMGLGYRDLTEVNPGLVMASITGFGQTGPRRSFACADIVAFAMSGLMYISGDPSRPPCKPPETQAYYFGSLFAALGVLAALYQRERSGRGDHIDVSMQETLATQEHVVRQYANEGVVVKRQGSQHNQVAPAKIFPCRNGYVYLYVTRQHWKGFLEVWADHPAALEAPEWESNPFRRARAEEINSLVEGFTSGYSKEELTGLLQSHGIPCMPVNRPQDFVADEQVQARKFFVPVAYPDCGTVYQPGAPFIINGSRPPLRPAPALGEDDRSAQGGTGRVAQRERGAPNEAGRAGERLPLSGMRILSFDHVLAGPYGMTLLAELGADVIKVESRRGGLDPFRFFGTGQDPNLSPRFLEFNRNKRSLAVNLKHPEGRSLIKDLARRSDAVLDNFSVHVMSNLGLGYEELAQAKRDIIALRMPGLGCTGPKMGYSTVGTNITAFTGFTYLWNHPGKTDPPVGSQTVYPDYVSGVVAAILITAGVLHRDRTGRGLSVDLSQAEASAYMIGASLMDSLVPGHDVKPMGNDSPHAAPQGCYPCRGEDRWCAIAVETEGQWRSLARALGRPELAEEPRFQGFERRRQHAEELNALIQTWTRDKECFDAMAALQKAGVPCGVVQNGADLIADGHLKARGFLVEQDNQRVGRVVLPGFPVKFAGCAIKPKWEFPELGRDNQAILQELLGYSSERIAQLAREGVLE
jgi:crotonobetainyl-CoA:carnitine CoA-transferase CaiB-like acyl-CoA transferase